MSAVPLIAANFQKSQNDVPGQPRRLLDVRVSSAYPLIAEELPEIALSCLGPIVLIKYFCRLLESKIVVLTEPDIL